MQADMFETPFEKLYREKLALTRAAELANGALVAFQAKLAKECTHDVTTPVEWYLPGDYYNRAESGKADQCVVCGQKRNVRTNQGGYD